MASRITQVAPAKAGRASMGKSTKVSDAQSEESVLGLAKSDGASTDKSHEDDHMNGVGYRAQSPFGDITETTSIDIQTA